MSKAELRGNMAWCPWGALAGYTAGTESFMGKLAGFRGRQESEQQGCTCHAENSGLSFVEFDFDGRRELAFIVHVTNPLLGA